MTAGPVEDVEDQPVIAGFWAGLDLLRPLAWAYVVYQFVARLQEVEHPGRGFVILGVLGAWTALSLMFRRRTRRWYAIELALAAGGILASGLVDSRQAILDGAPTVPGIWAAATVVSWAVLTGARGGLFAALVVCAADLLLIGTPTGFTLHNMVILILLGLLIGYSSDRVRQANRAVDELALLRARALERERLARTVHDGVLQALSYVHRRGLEIGGETAELGRLAAEQEQNLRDLIRAPISDTPQGEGEVDLVTLVGARSGTSVTFVDLGESILMPADRAREVDAAVGAALDNVARHAGPGAHAWILLEPSADEVAVTVRDNGAGFEPARLAEARNEGRLGVASSILGRMTQLGGSATVTSTPTGTRVQMRAPLRAREGGADV